MTTILWQRNDSECECELETRNSTWSNRKIENISLWLLLQIEHIERPTPNGVGWI
jgi:hypothetical protein